jgi:hypothetical protein
LLCRGQPSILYKLIETVELDDGVCG